MAIKIKKYNNVSWINIIKPNNDDLKYLKENFKFHHLDYEDVTGESQHSKIDIYPSYAFIVLRVPVTHKDSKLLSSHEVDIFLGKDFLITIQEKKIKILNEYFYKIANNKKLQNQIFQGNAALLFYHVLEEMYGISIVVTDWLIKEINKVEKQVYDEQTKIAVKNLAIFRRNILNFKAIIEPQRFVIRTLVGLKNDYLSAEYENYFDDIADYIERIYALIATSKEIVEGLHETNEALTTFRLNRTMKILTVFSVSMLPLTLLTGLYGMNLNSLPFIHNEQLVWYIFGALILIIVGIFAFLKKKDII